MKLFRPFSHKLAYWQCQKFACHKWSSPIYWRTKNKYGCPYCSNRRLCECGCNSLQNFLNNDTENKEYNNKLISEWDEGKNGSMKKYLPCVATKVNWICEKNPIHKWQTSLSSRIYGKGCPPQCSSSKLEKESQEALTNLSVNFISQSKHDICKNKKDLPYDFKIELPNKNILFELQGEQHFHYNSYYNKKDFNIFLKRLNTDIKKSYQSHKNFSYFLSVSYLCQNSIQNILSSYLKDTEKYTTLCRYYITPEIYLEYNNENSILEIPANSCYTNDSILTIFQTFYLQINAILKNKDKLGCKFEYCSLCEEMFLPSLMHHHYKTEGHINAYEEKLFNLSEQYEEQISLTLDGESVIVFEKNEETDNRFKNTDL